MKKTIWVLLSVGIAIGASAQQAKQVNITSFEDSLDW